MDRLPQYSGDDIVNALERLEHVTTRGGGLAEVAAELGMSRETLSSWRRDFSGMRPSTVDDIRMKRKRQGYTDRRTKVKGSPKVRPYAPTMPLEDRRTQVLDAGLRVLVEQGAHAVSLHTVGQHLALSRPPMLKVFPDSEQLRQGVLDREITTAVNELAAIVRDEIACSSPLDDAAQVVVDRYLRATSTAPYRWKAMAQLTRSPTPAFRDQAHHALHTVVVGFVESREVPSHSAGVLAHLVLAALLEAADLMFADQSWGSSDTLRRSLVTSIAALVASSAGHDQLN